ncbi:allophanate hydrolase-related protein [Amycolatopsis thermoflava]|uniref:allophanate hydrolase-related protein n=1 Tax=Amycolatopsis thermoflava TaxID=84480 RepID=UPI003D726D03
MDTPPLPPEPPPPPPVAASAQRAVAAALDLIATADRPGLWATLRAGEDVLVDAKAVDDHGGLPLAGLLAAAEDTLSPTADPVRRLAEAGAVVLGTARGAPAAAELVALGLIDLALTTQVPRHPDVVCLTPTAGLLPAAGAVVAGTLADGCRALTAMTDPGAWPADVRLAAGERPRLTVSHQHRTALRHAVGELLVAGVEVTTVDTGTAMVPIGQRPGTSDGPQVTAHGVRFLGRPFDDQVLLDLAALLTGEQLKNPYPATGTALIVFGAHLRGQPRNVELRDLGARFTGDVRTAPRYRMRALDGQAGVHPSDDGAALLGERWLLAPGSLARFRAALPPPMTLGPVELDDGETATALLNHPASGPDITEFGDWRAYLRHRTATRRGPG